MKKKAARITLVTALAAGLLLTTTMAEASTLRWPSPAWFAQFSQTSQTTQTTQASQTHQAATSTTASQTTTFTATSTLTAQERQSIDLINQERSRRGNSQLTIDPELSRWARIKSQDMVDNNYFAHRSPTYGSASQMLKNGGVTVRFVGENLAKSGSVAGAHSSLMNSSIHRANLLNTSYTHVGVGIAYKGSTIYITQLFAAK